MASALAGELTCVVCSDFYSSPVLLTCHHSFCLMCVRKLAEGLERNQENENIGEATADVNVVSCPQCGQETSLNKGGVDDLPRNFLLQNIVKGYLKDKERERKKMSVSEFEGKLVLCDFCVGSSAAARTCLECRLAYCSRCLPVVHPPRGNLARHTLRKPELEEEERIRCAEHGETVTIYCSSCQTAICMQCDRSGRHRGHDRSDLTHACQATKDDLESSVRGLKERNSEIDNFVKRLSKACGTVQVNGLQLVEEVHSRCTELHQLIEQRERSMLGTVYREMEKKLCVLEDQITAYKEQQRKGEGLVEFSREALKEQDHATFLQTVHSLITRVRETTDDRPAFTFPTRPSFENLSLDLESAKVELEKIDLLDNNNLLPDPDVKLGDRDSDRSV
ncbi:PREDICTED: probable E3 ubiquitin-protein ligase MID2 [Branchiostoma belcheri]|uniref:Probable E3 ubiquitin-protein ligase MID2 n=1 Tax=Branchiostoma belcheri TaxID=7741 RepID=A0A6P4Y2Z0_BRABE|nr:PREDICTED: probable E3 ubiquitin-protein ligase MID2 [Branchiostoma belcheri]